ncbi:protein FAM63B-like, partial [Planoprotostelium fungivorum]
VLLSEFLSRTSNQLTDHGIERLQKTMEEGELAVLFRNNHFSTICMHQGQVYSLVTDIGYEKEGEVVWELLSVDGNSQFFSSHFTPHEEIHR